MLPKKTNGRESTSVIIGCKNNSLRVRVRVIRVRVRVRVRVRS
jgi:hypothetical protein